MADQDPAEDAPQQETVDGDAPAAEEAVDAAEAGDSTPQEAAPENEEPPEALPELVEDEVSAHDEQVEAPTEAEVPVNNEQEPVDGADNEEVQAQAPEEVFADAEGEAPITEETAEAPTDAEQPPAEEEEGQAEQPPAEGGEGDAQPPSEEQPVEDGDKPTADGEEAPAEQTEDGEAGAPAEAPEGDGAPASEAQEGEGEEAAAAPVEAPEGEQQEGETQETQEGEAAEGTPQEGDAENQEEKSGTPVPQSDTFADGERVESPVAVGEKLSRGPSPSSEEPGQEVSQEIALSPPVPGTPDRMSAVMDDSDEYEEEEEYEEEYEEEEEDEYEEEEPEFAREELIEKYHQALAERQQLQDQNYQLQNKLAEYFRKKKNTEENRQDVEKNVTDQEQRYLKYMASLDELRRQDTEERETFKFQIEELKDRCAEKQDKVNDERFKFMEFKNQIALGAINSRSGKAIPPKDVEIYLAKENSKESEVVNVRLDNIKLKNKLRKKEAALKSKEELAEGLHLIDFEQLKIENQTYNEKIEERNEELLKLRKKITNTVQVLTHLKEKLQFVHGENATLKSTLRDVEDQAGRKRDILTRTKQARDGLRIDNQRLRQSSGLLGNEPLLRDYEERKDESDELKERIESLRLQHAELTLNINGVRRKLDNTNLRN